MEKQEYKGRFWLPNNPERKLLGDFVVSPKDHISLTVYEPFEAKLSWNEFCELERKELAYDVICGELTSGKSVLLLKATYWGGSIAPTIILKLGIEYLVFNKDYQYLVFCDFAFKKVSFRIPHLEKIIHKSLIKPSWNTRSFNIKSKWYDKDEYTINSDFKLLITYGVNCNLEPAGKNLIEDVTSIMLEFKNPEPIDIIVKMYIHRLANLLTLLTGEYQCPIDIKLFDKDDTTGKEFSMDTSYAYFNVNLDIERPSYTFNYSLLRQNLGSYVNKFFQFCRSGSNIIDTYISGLFRNKSTVEFCFITAVISLDGLTRDIITNSKYLNKTLFKQYCIVPLQDCIKHIDCSVVGTNLVKRLENVLESANEMSFLSKLEHVHKLYNNIFKDVLIENSSTFIKEICVTRNKYVHVKKNRPNTLTDYSRLVTLWKNAQVMFDVCLYKYIDIPDDVVIKLIRSVYNSYVNQFTKDSGCDTGLRRPTLPNNKSKG